MYVVVVVMVVTVVVADVVVGFRYVRMTSVIDCSAQPELCKKINRRMYR
jgi:hypothetical protein